MHCLRGVLSRGVAIHYILLHLVVALYTIFSTTTNPPSRAGLSFQSDHATNTNDRIYVYFAIDATVSKANIKTYVLHARLYHPIITPLVESRIHATSVLTICTAFSAQWTRTAQSEVS